MTSVAPHDQATAQLDKVRRAAARWRADLQQRSAGHARSDALTELAWADHHALAEIERAAHPDPA